jgi:hypothetical protein
MVSDCATLLCIKVFDFDTEDMRNELLLSGIVEVILKEVTVLNKEWMRYVHCITCSRIALINDKPKGPAGVSRETVKGLVLSAG